MVLKPFRALWDVTLCRLAYNYQHLEDHVASSCIVVEEDFGTLTSALRMEAAGCFEMLVTTQKLRRLYIFEDWNN